MLEIGIEDRSKYLTKCKNVCLKLQSCYADAFDNPNGDIVFNLGCRDRQLCGSFGKRSNGNTQFCAQCCLGNLCNAALCGQTGLPSVGPVCFKCDQANTPSSCNTIALCGRDDVCHVEKTIGSLTHATLYKSGCLHKTNCDRHAQGLSLIGRKRYDNTVMSGNDLQIQCCDSNLCNHGNVSSASGSAVTTGSVAPTHSSLSTQQSICSTSPCIHGKCFSASTDYFCQCEQGWQGKNCDQHQGPCIGSPCVHGRCFESGADYACQCENGWQGKNCDQTIDYCVINPCLHGTCSDGASSYVCHCSVGWQGTNCDQKINYCSIHHCLHGTCSDGASSYVCHCSVGWQGTNCDQKINFCSSNPCLHGTCSNGASSYVCQCSVGWQGTNCDQRMTPIDCSIVLSQHSAARSGVYIITTPLTHTLIQVYCDMVTDGGGWTMFQKRYNGMENFTRNFRDYENGFGNPHAEHWLGLKHVHEITSTGSYKLRLDVTHFNRSSGYVVYGGFSLEPGTNYTLNLETRLDISGINPGYPLFIRKGAYHTAAGTAFSTYDHDVDKFTYNCAYDWKGGWWYDACYSINLNGEYLPGILEPKAMRFNDNPGLYASSMMFKRT